MASSQRLASQKNREPRLAVRAVKGTLFRTGGGGGGRENMSHLSHCPSGAEGMVVVVGGVNFSHEN